MIDKVMDYERPDYVTYGHKIQLLAEVLFPSNWQPNDEISLNGADIAVFLDEGRKLAEDTPERLMQDPVLAERYFK